MQNGSVAHRCPFFNGSASNGSLHNSKNGVTHNDVDDDLNYNDYLKLKQLLTACTPLSPCSNNDQIDEHLFIITHQSFELWFKEILLQFDLVCQVFGKGDVRNNIFRITSSLNRVKTILKFSLGHFDVLETMPPMAFLEFRDYLGKANGGQSIQFRRIEEKLGLQLKNKNQIAHHDYLAKNSGDGMWAKIISQSSKTTTVFDAVQEWLASIGRDKEDFWRKYHFSANRWIDDTADGKAASEIAELKSNWNTLFSAESYEQARCEDSIRFNHEAMLGALFVYVMRSESYYGQAYEVLSHLLDVDAFLAAWRHRHALMVHRMIGDKPGTGGSSGYNYLLSTVSDEYKVFKDICNVASYIIPKAYVPKWTAS